jgi:hypothetical protein
VLRVTSAADIGEFLLLRSAADEGEVTTTITQVFWFPDRPVRSGDLVVLYTKSGAEKQRTNKNGSTSHFFYWGNPAPLWDKSEHVAVIAHLDEWNSTLAGDQEPEEGPEGSTAGEAKRA